jgi:proline iminopeptidase
MEVAIHSFGLSADVIQMLREVFSHYPETERVMVFGSRAKGTYKSGSDIDLAVIATNMSPQRFAQLWSELDSLPLIFKVDVLHWNTLANSRLQAKIMEEGQLLYP